MKKRHLLTVLVIAVCGCCDDAPVNEEVTVSNDPPAVQGPTESESTESEPTKLDVELVDGIYLVDHYDAKRDAKADLASAIEAGQSMNRRILLEVGGNW